MYLVSRLAVHLPVWIYVLVLRVYYCSKVILGLCENNPKISTNLVLFWYYQGIENGGLCSNNIKGF